MAKILLKTYNMLLEKIEDLKEDVKKNSEALQTAADHGDLKENAEYKVAKERMAFLFSTMQRFEGYMGSEIIDGSKISSDEITYGTTVKIEDLGSGDVWDYNILGPVEYELELMPDIVTYGSPLAQQMLGKKIGDEVEVQLPVKKVKYKILDITPIV